MPFLHGSQGCSTYMRRYIISHFREPMDIAASELLRSERGLRRQQNLQQGQRNVTSTIPSELIGIATTCLTETIGEDVAQLLNPV